MAIFGKKKMSTAEEVLRAVESLPEDEKGKFMETIKGHIDESVAAQEVDEGDVDEQTAEDRIDESEGEENAIAEEDETAEDKAETPDETPVAEEEEENVVPKAPEENDKLADVVKTLGERLEALETKFEAMQHKPVEADENVAHKLDKLADRFGG